MTTPLLRSDKLDALYSVLQSIQSRSSGTGTSFYGSAAQCGMKSQLDSHFPWEEETEYEIGQTTATGRRKANGRRAGVFFHALQQFWRTGTLDTGLIVDAEHEDYDFELAVRSFRNYRKHYLDNRHNRGTVIDAEVKYPATPAQEASIRQFFHGAPFTMRYDLLVNVTPEISSEINLTSGTFVKPGRWLVDYKLISAIDVSRIREYVTGFQALAYPVAYNLCNPDTPVEGIIFDVTARVKDAKPHHFFLGAVPATQKSAEIVRYGVMRTSLVHAEGAAQPLNCHGKYGECRWLTLCPRQGNFSPELLETAKDFMETRR